jgi:fermentation-respiration switch protein FrsA (DUF1100 family)
MGTLKTIVVSLLLALPLSGCKAIINGLAFYPDNINVIATEDLPEGIQELSIEAEDKVKTTSLYLPSPGTNKLLIYFPGNAGNIYHRIPGLLTLRKSGVNVIGVSYRGYGKSEGQATEEGIYLDGKAIYQYAVDELGFAEQDIFVFGRSIGTTVALDTAANKNLRGVILVTPLTSAKQQAKAGGMGVLAPLAGDAFDNLSRIDKVLSPILVIHGTKDRIIPFAMGEAIYERARGDKAFVKIEGGDHNNLQGEFSQQYWPPIIRFIQES